MTQAKLNPGESVGALAEHNPFEFGEATLTVVPEAGGWRAVHRDQPCGAPAEIRLGDQTIVENCHFYLDGLGSGQALLQKRRAHRRAGAAVVEESGLFPFGRELGFRQSSRYAFNHLRATFDFEWPAGQPVERHLGVGSLFLPGQWQSYFCLPPARHLAEGAAPARVSIPAPPTSGETMIGHWHRPPLALVFRRADGTRVEVGSGSDLWRWQQSLGAGPESGSYKLMLRADGIRVVREPLMTCAPFTPAAQAYRFKWHLAWDQDGGRQLPTEGGRDGRERHELSLASGELPAAARRRQASGTDPAVREPAAACWLAAATQREIKRRVRQLAALPPAPRILTIRDFSPGFCLDGSHLQRGRRGELEHWDLDAMLELVAWMRRQLGSEWQVAAADDRLQDELPSLAGLFRID